MCVLLCVLLLTARAHAEQVASRPAQPAEAATLTREQFLEHVSRGAPVESHTIPHSYLEAAMAQATDDRLKLEKNRGARLAIRKSVITGALLQPQDVLPKVSADRWRQQAPACLPSSPEPLRMVRLRLEVSNGTIRPRIGMANVVFGDHVTFDNVEFEQDVDLTGSIFANALTVTGGTFKRFAKFSTIATTCSSASTSSTCSTALTTRIRSLW